MVHYYLQMQKYAFLRIKSRFTIICLIKYSYYNNVSIGFVPAVFQFGPKRIVFGALLLKNSKLKRINHFDDFSLKIPK